MNVPRHPDIAEFVWYDQSPYRVDTNPRDSGIQTSLAAAFDENGNKIASVRISFLLEGFDAEALTKEFFRVPYVVLSSVEDRYLRRGIGTALYEFAAKELAKQGKVLRAGYDQSSSAEALWRSFKGKFPITTVHITNPRSGERQSFPAIDFR